MGELGFSLCGLRQRREFVDGHEGDPAQGRGVVAAALREVQYDLGLRHKLPNRGGMEAHDHSQRIRPALARCRDSRQIRLTPADDLLVSPVGDEEFGATPRQLAVGA